MKIEIAMKNIPQLITDLCGLLGNAKRTYYQFHKGRNGKLYKKYLCKCGKYKLENQGIDFEEAKRDQKEYIDMLDLTIRRLMKVCDKHQKRGKK